MRFDLVKNDEKYSDCLKQMQNCRRINKAVKKHLKTILSLNTYSKSLTKSDNNFTITEKMKLKKQ